MKIFLTGATGFLGSHTARLLARKHHLTALVRKTSSKAALQDTKIRFFEGHLEDSSHLISGLEGQDIVVHIAGAVKALNREDFFRVNTEGTKNLIHAVLKCKNRPKFFLHISTIAVLNPEKDGNDFCISPEKCSPLSLYGQSKLAGEKQLRLLDGAVPFATLRPPILYGPWDQELLPLFKAIQRWGIAPVYQKGENQFSICYIENIAQAILQLIENPPTSSSIFCLDDGAKHSWRSFAQALSKVIGKKANLLSIPRPLFHGAAYLSTLYSAITRNPSAFSSDKLLEIKQKSWVCGFKNLNQTTHWMPQTPLEQGLQKTLEFYRNQGWL